MRCKIIYLAIPILFLLNCSKEDKSTSINDIIYGLRTDSTSVLADGTSIVGVICNLDSMATSDRFGVLFKINIGTFIGSSSDTTIVQQAQFIGNSLVAKALIKVPQSPGIIRITAQPNLPTVKNNNYILKDSIPIYPSIPNIIYLSSSNSGIVSNYGSEITFVGTLYNTFKHNVSFGYKVIFGDSLEGSIPAHGNWRNIVDTVNSSSQTSAIYSVESYPVGTPIYITCSLVQSTGVISPNPAKTIIYINK